MYCTYRSYVPLLQLYWANRRRNESNELHLQYTWTSSGSSWSNSTSSLSNRFSYNPIIESFTTQIDWCCKERVSHLAIWQVSTEKCLAHHRPNSWLDVMYWINWKLPRTSLRKTWFLKLPRFWILVLRRSSSSNVIRLVYCHSSRNCKNLFSELHAQQFQRSKQ